MADAAGALRIDVIANTGRFSAGMGRASKVTRGFSLATKQASGAVKGLMIGLGGLTTMGGLSTMLGFSAVTYSTVRFAGAVEKLNQSMHSSLAIMGDVSESMKSKMMATTMQVAATTRYSADEIAKSYYYLASAGMNVQQSIAALPAVARFAQAGMFDMARATDLVTDAQSALGLKSEDAQKNLQGLVKVSDALVKANTLANASVEQFSISLTTKAGAALRTVNKGIEEGLAALAVYADQGIKGAESGTALSIVMRDLQTKSVQNEEAFRRMNVAVFDSMDNMRNLADIIRDLEMALSGLSDFAKKSLLLDLKFSDKSVNFLLQLLGKSGEMRAYENKLDAAGGTTKDVADKQMTTWMKAWNEISADLLKFGEKHVLPLVEALGKSASKGEIGEKAETGWWLASKQGHILGANRALFNATALGAVGLGSTVTSGNESDATREFRNAIDRNMLNQWDVFKDHLAGFFGTTSVLQERAKAEEQALEAINAKNEADKKFLAEVGDTVAGMKTWAGNMGLDMSMSKAGSYGPVDMRQSAKARAQSDLWKEEREAAEKAREKMMKAGEKLAIAMQTPMEAHVAAMKNLTEMLSEGAISKAVFDRAAKASYTELMGTPGSGSLNNAIEFGTQAYYVMEAQQRERQQRESYLREQVELLQEIAVNTSGEENKL